MLYAIRLVPQSDFGLARRGFRETWMNGFGGIATRIWICAALGQVLALLAFFNGIEVARHAQTEQRLHTLLARVSGPVAASGALGFPLEYQSDLQGLVDALVVKGGRDEDIYILDADGTVLFASNQSAIGSPAPEPWFARRGDAAGGAAGTWVTGTPDETIVGTDVLNEFSARVGMIVVRASREGVMLDVFSTLRTTVGVSVVFLALVGVVAFLGVSLATRGLSDKLRSLTERYWTAGSDVAAGVPPDVPGAASLEAAGLVTAAMSALTSAAEATDHVATPEARSERREEMAA
jgi:hypothetical protein